VLRLQRPFVRSLQRFQNVLQLVDRVVLHLCCSTVAARAFRCSVQLFQNTMNHKPLEGVMEKEIKALRIVSEELYAQVTRRQRGSTTAGCKRTACQRRASHRC
jgi:hypothetical protein